MKTIAQFVRDGIQTLSKLEDALRTAMQLEFSTIPPYLCAQWSIATDPSGVADMISTIAVQEMYHFALAGNILTAIGGTPNVAHPDFVTSYPTHVLPGGIVQALPVDLKPLSKDQLEVFMQIEFPEFRPVALLAGAAPATVGTFYTTISDAITKLNPVVNQDAHFLNLGEAVQVKTVADAKAEIIRVKSEGEGTKGSPDQPPGDALEFAHYYIFKEIFTGSKLNRNGNEWSFSGDQITFPEVKSFESSNMNPSPSIEFNRALTQLLIDLQACWTDGESPNIGAMFNLQTLGVGLIEQGLRPEFKWNF